MQEKNSEKVEIPIIEINQSNPLPGAKTREVYVGAAHYNKLTSVAVLLTSKHQKPYTQPMAAKYLIDKALRELSNPTTAQTYLD